MQIHCNIIKKISQKTSLKPTTYLNTVIYKMEVAQLPIIAINKIRGSKARIIEQINTLGFQDYNKKLVESGFVKLSQNLSILKKNNGDLEAVIKILNEKMAKKALRLQKKKDEQSKDKELIKTEKKRSRSEKPLRKVKRAMKLADVDIMVSDKEQNVTAGDESAPTKKEKRMRRIQRDKSEKVERKQLKERSREELTKKYEEWPTGVKHVFLDGNNMLFADKFLLKLRLKRKQRKAEEALSKLASIFATRIGNFHTVLIFDSIKINTSKDSLLMQDGQSYEFEICSARPSYSTSDDALVEWMDKQSNPAECLVVTSDRGLQQRLKEKGVSHLMKTGNWFRLIKQALGEDYTKIANEYSTVIDEENDVAKNS